MSTNTENKQIVVYNKITINSFLTHIAGFMYVPDERKGYYLCMAIKVIYQNQEMKKILQDKYKDKYQDIIHTFHKHFTLMTRIKNYKDIIQDDEKIRENINHPYQKELNKIIEKVPLIYTITFELLNTILQHSNLGAYTPTNEQTRQYSLAYKKVTYKLTDKQLGFQPTRPRDSPTDKNVY